MLQTETRLTKICLRAFLRWKVFTQVHIPALHPQSKLTTLLWRGSASILVDFWDLISAPALVDLKINCEGLTFTDHSRTAPPAAAAALQRGTWNARFILETDSENLLQPERAIMESCGMAVASEIEMGSGKFKLTTLELARSTPEVFEVMRM